MATNREDALTEVSTLTRRSAKLRKAEVDVIDIPYEQTLDTTRGGNYCGTCQMVRDRGPKLDDMK